MRTVMLWGGFAGFSLAALAGYSADRPLDLILRDAAVACLAGAWLLRWWWSQLERALTETLEIRRRHAEQEAAAEAAAQEKKDAAVLASKSASRREAANPALARSSAPAPAMPART